MEKFNKDVEYISRSEFVRKHLSNSMKWQLRLCAIVCYILAGTSIVTFFSRGATGTLIIDGTLLLAFALGMHLGGSKVCAVCILVLGCVEILGGLILHGAIAGLLWLVAGIMSFATFNTIDRYYEEYRSKQYMGLV